MRTFILFFVFSFSVESFAGQWAFRARENFEVTQASESSQSFSGFSSTINFGYEEPFKYFYGLGIQPGLGSFEEKDDIQSLTLGNEIRIYQIGSDIKYFPVEGSMGFLRNTIFYALVSTKTAVDNIGGYGGSLSIGWEFWLYDLFALAPEVGYKYTRLRTDEDLSTLFISVGLHFYKFKIK
jgi:hypothetical protein